MCLRFERLIPLSFIPLYDLRSCIYMRSIHVRINLRQSLAGMNEPGVVCIEIDTAVLSACVVVHGHHHHHHHHLAMPSCFIYTLAIPPIAANDANHAFFIFFFICPSFPLPLPRQKFSISGLSVIFSMSVALITNAEMSILTTIWN